MSGTFTPKTDLTGRRFGTLTVIALVGQRVTAKSRATMWKVRCGCGRERVVRGGALTARAKPLYACRACKARDMRTHNMHRHPAYAVWAQMLYRCRTPTSKYWDYYGGRGIEVCPRWYSFDLFWSDMGPTYKPGLTIERVNNNAHYEPGNCIWATSAQQSRNKRNNRLIDTPWGPMLLMDASKRSGISIDRLRYRLTQTRDLARIFSPDKWVAHAIKP